MREESDSINRRSALKKIGLSGVALTTAGIKFSRNATAAKGSCETDFPKTPQEQWSTEAVHNYAYSKYDLYQSTAVSWYCSWDGGRGWTHDVDVGTAASGQWDDGAPYGAISRNKLEVYPSDYDKGGYVNPDSRDDLQGMYPSPQTGALEDFIEVTTDLAIGTLGAPAAFAVAVDDVAETFEPYPDGQSSIYNGNGFRLKNNTGTFQDPWTDAGHYQRMIYYSGSESEIDDELNIISEMFDQSGIYTRIKYQMLFNKTDQPGTIANDESSQSSTSSVEAKDEEQTQIRKASEMTPEERETYGVKKVNKDSPSAIARRAKRVDGELPEWIATNLPVSVRAYKQEIDSGEVVSETEIPVTAHKESDCNANN
ncbi:hypothetical protein [Halorussus lipolyticus]|uniref:hypothetical protein n=1 Tax=Halorussus lipolyticus TaxID=3034024 RepID=UPI0023E891B5|nr:hypothetical protein [Halorussus sp. DT80]